MPDRPTPLHQQLGAAAEATRNFHDPHDVFDGFGVEGSPAIVGDPIVLEPEEDGRSSHAAALSDGALCVAVVSTEDALRGDDGAVCERSFVHLTRRQVLQLLDMLPAPGDGTMDD